MLSWLFVLFVLDVLHLVDALVTVAQCRHVTLYRPHDVAPADAHLS